MAWEVTKVIDPHDDALECLVVLDGFPFKVAATQIDERQARAFEVKLARFRDARLAPYGGAQDLAASLLAKWQEILAGSR